MLLNQKYKQIMIIYILTKQLLSQLHLFCIVNLIKDFINNKVVNCAIFSYFCFDIKFIMGRLI